MPASDDDYTRLQSLAEDQTTIIIRYGDTLRYIANHIPLTGVQ